jgi:hypothetical protein
MNDLAKRAYDAWWDVMAGRGSNGAPATLENAMVAVPKFESAAPITRQAWFAAASAVEDAISAERVA